MKSITWKIEVKGGKLVLTKHGEVIAAFASNPGQKFHELTDLRDALNAQEAK